MSASSSNGNNLPVSISFPYMFPSSSTTFSYIIVPYVSVPYQLLIKSLYSLSKIFIIVGSVILNVSLSFNLSSTLPKYVANSVLL